MHHTSHITHHLPSIIQYLSSTTHHAASRISLHQHQHQHPHHPSALSPHPSALRPQASGLKPQASGLMIMIMTMIMIMNMIMIMIMTMVSYHHYEPPRAVRGSVGGCSMDMWCPDGIGRESWDREGREGSVLTLSP